MMRYAKISPEGDYMPPPPANAKAAYATMVYVRATIVEDAGWILARATTIAVPVSLSSPAFVFELSMVILSLRNVAFTSEEWLPLACLLAAGEPQHQRTKASTPARAALA